MTLPRFECIGMARFLKTPEALIFIVSGWIALVSNTGLWRVVVANTPPGTLLGIPYLAAFLGLTVGLISLVLLLLTYGRATRITLGIALVAAACASYFTSRYGVLFDPGMMTNIVETDTAEALELMSTTLIAVVVITGILPALAIWRYPFARRRLTAALLQRSAALIVALAMIVAPLLAEQKDIFSVARNHHELRHMIAPVNLIAASYVLLRDRLETPPEYRAIALDASHPTAAAEHRKPVVHVLIVGETARAANFRLNGYALETNPELAQREGVRFVEARSCGTATAVSLPCMFSIQEHDGFDRDATQNEDNLLDIAARSGYDVTWIDNGNGCKGICVRVAYQDVHLSDDDSVCPEGTCFDEILVHELKNVLAEITKDTLIVLHQLGSHGPAYYRRYPREFALFQPDCQSANFGDCSQQQIINSYDNTIVYTDHVIAGAIEVLDAHADDLDTSLLYVSDHGESLGEHGLYLHGMPYSLAPAEQTTVPMIFWRGDDVPSASVMANRCFDTATGQPVSHDNLFHMELGLLGIATAVYRPDLDILSGCRTGLPIAAAAGQARAVH